MNKILLDGQVVTQFVKESLPTLIHGGEGSGASLYTVSLAANFYEKGFSILFLCGFPMAEEEFVNQVGDYDIEKVKFYTQEKVEEFKEILASENIDDLVIVVKNIELFGKDIFELVSERQAIIISGDINKTSFKNIIIAKQFATKIFFSPFENIEMPELSKYEGFVISDDFRGVTSLKI